MHRSPRPSSRAFGVVFSRTIAVAVAAAVLAGAVSPAFAGRVFIDPGHGGSFSGAYYGGVSEASINLAIARELNTALEQRGYSTAMSRNSNVNTTRSDIPTWSETNGVLRYGTNGAFNVYDDLQARCDMANGWGADIFVSIHANASTNTSAHGAETYWRDTSSTDRILSQRLASFIQEEYVRETGLSNRGVKANAYYVLRWSNMPAILIETGFMSNATERGKLTNPTFQRRAAQSIARGIDRFLESDPFTPVYARIAGSNRFETAAAVAQRGWNQSGGTVILTSGRNWPDALCGTPLSRVLDAPLLLTEQDELPQATRDRISAHSPTRIVVLGGESVVSSSTIAAAVAATGRAPGSVTVETISGEGRFDTSADVARRVSMPADGRIFVTSGRDFADALSVSPYAGSGRRPILLVENTSIPPAIRAYLQENSSAIRTIQVIGGTAAVSACVAEELEAFGTVERIAGADRYRTNIEVIKRLSGSASFQPLVAGAFSFPDTLCAGALGAKEGRPVVLTGERYLSPYTREFLYNNRSRIADPTIVGGPVAVSYQMDWMIRKGFAR